MHIMKHKLFKKLQNKKTSIVIIVISLYAFFLLGFWYERYEFDKKLSSFSSNVIENITTKIFYTFGKKNKFIIDMNFVDYENLGKSRLDIIKNGKALNNMQTEVPAIISFNNKKNLNSKISLKGTHNDHWEDNQKWSFKIKLTDDKKILAKNEFVLQHPKTRGYLYEWLFMCFLKNENLIFSKVEFFNLIINGENLGLYNFTESETKELLNSNNRQNGPIVFFDKEGWVKETSKIYELGANDWGDSFFKASIKVVNSAEWINIPAKKKYLEEALYLLNSFRNESLKASDVFDVEQMSKILAIKAVFGAVEFDWKDIKFYYNPKSKKLEPIGREIHVDLNRLNHEPKTWWLNSDSSNFAHSKDQDIFLKLLYKDKIFHEAFLKNLNTISKKNYIDNVFKNYKNQFDINFSLLKKYYPHIKIFSKQKIYTQANYIQETLNPVNNLNAYYLNKNDNVLYLSVENLQKLPIKINYIKLKNGKIIYPTQKSIIIKEYTNNPIKAEIITFNCESNIDCFDETKKNQKIYYTILGQSEIKNDVIFPWKNIKIQ